MWRFNRCRFHNPRFIGNFEAGKGRMVGLYHCSHCHEAREGRLHIKTLYNL